MPKVTTRRRSSRARASQPRRQQFLLHCSIAAAVLALVLAFSDAESMRAHHHDAGQGHARPSKRRDTAATGREKFSIASAAAASCSSTSCDDPRRSRRVEGNLSSSSSRGIGGGAGGIHPFARTANGGAPGRGATARPATTAFVASSSWPAAAAICSTREDSSRASMSTMTRRRRRHAQPTQEQQPWLKDRVAGLAGPQHSSRGGRSSWRSDAHHTTTALHFSREDAGGLYVGDGPCCFYGPAIPALRYVASGSGSNSVPCMSAGGGVAGDGGRLTRPPLLITIGPQCAGKTSLLRGLAAKSKAARQREGTSSSSKSGVPSVTDVTIDDHPSVRDTQRLLSSSFSICSPPPTVCFAEPAGTRIRGE